MRYFCRMCDGAVCILEISGFDSESEHPFLCPLGIPDDNRTKWTEQSDRIQEMESKIALCAMKLDRVNGLSQENGLIIQEVNSTLKQLMEGSSASM